MLLTERVKNTLLRLWQADPYWQTIFAMHGWDYAEIQLKAMETDLLLTHLLNDELKINRQAKGFEDFALAGIHMIEPGSPSKSLLYHALASPNVYYKENSNAALQAFPTLCELDQLENFIYSLNPLDINRLIQQEGSENVAIAVFSYEYRQAINTTHRKHADLCFSRTGVARVGTESYKYEPNLRAFTTFLDDPQQNGMRVSPARYGAFIAVKRNIKDDSLNVLPFYGRALEGSDVAKHRSFWVPVHKLFAGVDCLVNQQHLSLSFSIHHENLKLKKVCEHLKQTTNRNLEANPYSITENLVEMMHFSDDDENRTASMWIIPYPHPLVEEAREKNGDYITIEVPANPENAYFAALTIPDRNGARSAPEYVNVRRMLAANGEVIELANKSNVSDLVAEGNYRAIMHIDYTCDGWILAVCPDISLKSLPAYSIVTAPDFIPFAEQRELIEWDLATTKNYWALEPWALCDSRLLPNITLKNSSFATDLKDKTSQTVTAIVGPLAPSAVQPNENINTSITRRSSFLPDAAAGEFQPGWDITWDITGNKMHLSAYGLGSPFLEDAKLCAALSTFWPAAAPDIARSYVMEGWSSVCPLTDEEIGMTDDRAWDGVPPPKRIVREGKDWVALSNFNHVDYVKQGLLGKFSIARIGQIDIKEYKDRVDALWQAYHILKALNEKAKWRVLSFRKINNTDANLMQAIGAENANEMVNNIFAITIYKRGEEEMSEDNKIVYEKITRENHFYIDCSLPKKIWHKSSTGVWRAADAALPA